MFSNLRPLFSPKRAFVISATHVVEMGYLQEHFLQHYSQSRGTYIVGYHTLRWKDMRQMEKALYFAERGKKIAVRMTSNWVGREMEK